MNLKKFWIIIVAVIAVAAAFVWKFRMKTYKNDEYGFSFKYRATYIEKYNKDLLCLLKNSNNGIEISATARKDTGERLKTLSQIGEGFANLLKIYKENYKIEMVSNETIIVSDGVKAQKVVVDITTTDNEKAQEIAVLIPAEGREITIVFFGTEGEISKNENEINKVIKSIKIY